MTKNNFICNVCVKDNQCELVLDFSQFLQKRGIKFEDMNKLVNEYFTSCINPTS